MTSPEAYRWSEDLDDAACVTVVAGGSAAALLGGLGADPDPEHDTDDLYGDGEVGYVVVTEVEGGVVGVERNGYAGSLEDRLLAAAGGRAAASIFWNVNDDNAFTCVRDGRVVANVDMYDAEDPDEVDLPNELRSLFERAAGDGGMWPVGLAMVEAFTGVQIPRAAGLAVSPAHRVSF